MDDGRRETEVAKLAINLSNKYSKSSMAVALASMMKYGGGALGYKKVIKKSLDTTADLKYKELKMMAKGDL